MVLASIAIVRAVLIKKYAQQFRAEAKVIQNLRAFVRSKPVLGRILIVLTILQYGIAVVFLIVFMIGLPWK